jgi:hypothetical protein
MKYEDEDYGYDQERQRRIDAMTDEEFRHLGIVKKARFGGALKKADWIQRSVHHDPRPDLPFREDMICIDEWIAYGLIAVAVGLIIMFGVLL